MTVFQSKPLRTTDPLNTYRCTITYDGPDIPKHMQVVYALIDPRTDKPFYIGATRDFVARMKSHTGNNNTKQLWQRKCEIALASLSAKVIILAYPLNDFDCQQIEYRLIRQNEKLLTNIQTARWQQIQVA